jgi:hypothetical protein
MLDPAIFMRGVLLACAAVACATFHWRPPRTVGRALAARLAPDRVARIVPRRGPRRRRAAESWSTPAA